MITDLKDAIFEVYCWQYSRSDCFNQLLLDLMMKADGINKKILGKAYPLLFEALAIWDLSADNGDQLFIEYGYLHKKDKKG